MIPSSEDSKSECSAETSEELQSEDLGHRLLEMRYRTMYSNTRWPDDYVHRNYHGSGGEPVPGGSWSRHTDGLTAGCGS